MNYSEWVMKYREEHGCKPLMSECYEAGQLSKQEELKSLLIRYKQYTKLHTNDEFNRGWVGASTCIVEDLEKLLK